MLLNDQRGTELVSRDASWIIPTAFRNIGNNLSIENRISGSGNFRDTFFGRVLALDNVIQITERDEAAYHEMITHVPILAHGSVKDVLIIGGGRWRRSARCSQA